jgi:D-tyrosyl-tRNA(Tyr) deacylase
MKVIVQKVKSASCTVDDKITGQIEKGFMLLVGFTHTDTLENVKKMAKKIVGLRIFDDENGKMNLDLNSVGGKILTISQFTLYGDATKGNRPSFVNSMPGSSAESLYNAFNEILRTEYNIEVETGIFGAHMYLNPICDGPVTIELEF